MLFIDQDTVHQVLPPAQAVEAIRQALIKGYDPAQDFQRQAYNIPGGQFLVMPSTTATATGIKVLTVNHHNANHEVERIQGNYLLFQGGSLSPVAVIDGAALTSLRTPAVSLSAIAPLLTNSVAPLQVLIFGTGPQGRWHEKVVRDLCGDKRDVSVTYVSRNRPDFLPEEAPEGSTRQWVQAGSDSAGRELGRADVILCCTTASEPLFTQADVREDVMVVAVGSHTPDARELDADFLSSGQVIVEDLETARREAGDVIQAVAQGALSYEDLILLKDLVTGRVTPKRTAPIIFKTTGMGWEDLVLAEEIYRLVRS